MKKRLYGTVYAIIVSILLMHVSGYAAEMNTYTINELGLSVKIPDNYTVVTRDINEDDPNLEVFARTKDEMLSFMTENNSYLDAYDEKLNNEIVITKTDSEFIDFNNISDDMLFEFMREIKSSYESQGITYIKSDIYDNDQIKFVKTYISQPNENNIIYGLQYLTIYNNKSICITLHSYENKITDEAETEIKNIIDNADFNVGIQSSDLGSYADGYEYIDPDTNLSFTVPASFTQEPLSAERDFIKAKFVHNDKNEVLILYGWGDAFENMPEEDKKDLRRGDLNNEMLTEAVFAEMFEINADDVEKVSYGNKEYYKITVKQIDDSTGIDLQVDMVNLVRIENGYMYYFQFSGRERSPYYKDFERLMESVNYPKSASISDYIPSPRSILFGFIVTIIIYALPIFIYRYAIRRKPVKPSTAKKITVIYGIFAFMVMSVILILLGGKGAGAAIILWSYMNYCMLVDGYKENKETVSNTESIENKKEHIEKNEIVFHHICTECNAKFKVRYDIPDTQNKIPNLKAACPKCGAKQIIHSSDIIETKTE